MEQIVLLTLIFTILFLAQTLIFTYLLLRLKRALRGPVPQTALEKSLEENLEEVTETELRIMKELESSGMLNARELSEKLGLSREHVARTLKKLVENGFLMREGKPYKYGLTGLGKKILRSHDITGDSTKTH